MFWWLSGVAHGAAFGRNEFKSRARPFFGLEIMKVMYCLFACLFVVVVVVVVVLFCCFFSFVKSRYVEFSCFFEVSNRINTKTQAYRNIVLHGLAHRSCN